MVVRLFVGVLPAHIDNFHAIPNVLRWVHGRSDVQNGKAIVFGVQMTAVVVIDDITHISAASIDDPVVSVER